MTAKIRCRKCNEYYEYVETREGGYDGAFSMLVRGHYHFYKCPCGGVFVEPSHLPIRS